MQASLPQRFRDSFSSAIDRLPERPRTIVRGVLARPLVLECIAVLAVALVALLVSSHLRSTMMNNYVRVAYGWLHGHTWIDYPGRWMDAVEYNGQHYGVDGPFPAILCLPWVLIWGQDANQTFVSIGVALAGLYFAWRLLLRLGVRRAPRLWLMLFLFAGTDYWWCAQLGDVWFLAHLCAVAATFAFLVELAGKRRGWLIGLLAIAAIESRNTLVMAMPFVLWAIFTGGFAEAAARLRGEPYDSVPRVDEPKMLAQFGGVIAVGVALWVTLNELMWGTLVDIGHTLYYHQDSWGHPTGSPFNVYYIPYQIYSFFLRPPDFVQWLQVPQWPYLKVNENGIALTFTSPALVLAFFAKAPRDVVRWMWFNTAAVALPIFMYYLNGWYQFGMRHALDFEPFLLVLMALAVRRTMPRWGVALVVWSSLVGAWGVWWWNTFMRTGD